MSDDELMGKQVEREIDGEVYKFTVMTTSQALITWDSMKKILGPSIDRFPKIDGDTKVSVSSGLEVILKGVLSLEGKLFADFCKSSVMPFVFKNEVMLKNSFDKEFQGRLDVLVRVVGAFIEVQYGSFSKLLPSGMADKLRSAVAKAGQLAAS